MNMRNYPMCNLMCSSNALTNVCMYICMNENVCVCVCEKMCNRISSTNPLTNATDNSNPIDVDKFFSLSQQVPIVVQQPVGPSSSLVQVFLENTSILGLISTPSHPLLLKTHDFVKQVSIYIF